MAWISIKKSRLMGLIFVILTLTSAHIVFATPSVWSLAYSGRLTSESGKPLTGPVTLEASFWDHSSTGSRLGSNIIDLGSVPLVNGVFHVNIEMSEAEFHTIFGDTSRIVYLQIRDVGANKTYPRQRFFAVPYAMKVPVDGTSIQFDSNGRLTAGGSVPNAVSTSAIQDAAVTASKIAPSAVDKSKLAGSGCSNGQVLQYNGSAWACTTISGTSDAGALTSGTLADARLSANVTKLGASIDEAELSGSAVNSTHIKDNSVIASKIAASSVNGAHISAASINNAHIGAGEVGFNKIAPCGINQMLQYNGTAWVCIAAPTNNNAGMLTAGTLDDARLSANVSLLGQSIGETEITANSVNSSQLKDLSVSNLKIAAGAVTDTKIGAGAVNATHMNSNGCSANQVLKYNGSNWACAADSVGSATTDASVLTSGTLADARLSANVSMLGSSIGESEVSSYSINAAHIQAGAVNSAHLNSNGCSANQILKYNGSYWACAADNAGSATTDASLLTSGTLADARLSANVSMLGSSIGESEVAINSINSAHIKSGAINQFHITSGSINNSHLHSSGCSANQILKFNGSSWTCSADNTGSATTDASALTSGTLATARLPTALQNLVNGSYNVGCYSMAVVNSGAAWTTIAQQCPANYFMSGFGMNPTGCNNPGNGCMYLICCHF